MPLAHRPPTRVIDLTTSLTEPVSDGLVLVGRVGAAYGIKGWVKLQSFTSPPEAIFDYQPWLLRRPEGGRGGSSVGLSASSGEWIQLEDGKVHGNSLVAKLAEINDRTAAERLTGNEISIRRSQLPALQNGEFYWVDLIGMQVKNLQPVFECTTVPCTAFGGM